MENEISRADPGRRKFLNWFLGTTAGALVAWLTGLVLTLMEMTWDQTLIATGAIRFTFPTVATYPGNYGPGILAFHFTVGYLFCRIPAMLEEGPRARVARGRQIADSLGIRATPTIMVNGRVYPRPPPRDSLFQIVRGLLDSSDER